jgi:hypothetical protein
VSGLKKTEIEKKGNNEMVAACLFASMEEVQCVLKVTVTYLLTYLHTLWSRVLLENLTGPQLVKKFAAFYGTRRLITALESARQLSLS